MAPDPNFCFPVRELYNDRLKLVPFDPDLHSATFFNHCTPQESTYTYLRVGPFANPQHLTEGIFENIIQPNPGSTLFAVIDKTRPPSPDNDVDSEGSLAGMVAYMASSAVHLYTEIGFLIILPSFQRTHVSSNAVGLLLHYALDDTSAGGLGLRRVEYQASALNEASKRLAQRFGFHFEGTKRWDYLFADGRRRGKTGNGRGVPPGAHEDDIGRDSVVFSLCWDDWHGGAKGKAQALMDRR